ncbi:MAG: response regulator, partial [Gammaproteobacteria bacterium]|nr:response regulator [Gammaproteobacteria bacterium]
MADEPTAADKPRILVADDSRVMRHAAKKILGQEYDIVEANDGEEAWEAIQSDTDIQVILCDLQMPNLDGFGVLERLRNAKDARLQDLPFIVITGKEDDEETRKQVLSDGATDFIGKPFESVQLQARTAAALKTRKLSETANVLEEQAVRDPVSGLLKRQHFMDRGSEAVSYVRRHGTALALACIEIDNFKQLFVHHGKDIADQLIAKAAEVMRNTVRHE